jgi:hypothetical protein
MTRKEFEACCEKNKDEGDEFERIKNPPTKRQDLCGMILLDRLDPDTDDIVSMADCEELCLGADVSAVVKASTEADVIALLRCGIWFDKERDCFFRNV